ncbi:hypothetical protein [Pseudalkalibacillus caeni]|nr:hypothetical protein [Pseudalkalibacillus caeni]
MGNQTEKDPLKKYGSGKGALGGLFLGIFLMAAVFIIVHYVFKLPIFS